MAQHLLSKICSSLVIMMLSSIPCSGMEKKEPKIPVNKSSKEQTQLKKYLTEKKDNSVEQKINTYAAAPHPLHEIPSSGKKGRPISKSSVTHPCIPQQQEEESRDW